MDMAKSIPPLMCNTPPPMDDGFDDEDEVSIVESIEDDHSSAPSTPSKTKSHDINLPVPDELPVVIQPFQPYLSNIDKHKTDFVKTPYGDSCHTDHSTTPNDGIHHLPPDNVSTVRSESPPSLDLQDPQVADGSFDDPNLDEIPEDDFYSNTDLSLPSLKLDVIVDTPPLSVDNRTEYDGSISSKDLTEDDLSLPQIHEIQNRPVEKMPSDGPDEIETVNSSFETTPENKSDKNDAYIETSIPIEYSNQFSVQQYYDEDVTYVSNPPECTDFNDSFDDFVEYSVETDFNSNKVSLFESNTTDNITQPQPDYSSTTYCMSSPSSNIDQDLVQDEKLNENTLKTDIESDNIEVENIVPALTSDVDCDNTFAADFSQFEVLGSGLTKVNTDFVSSISENQQTVDVKSSSDDDFGDFNDVPVVTHGQQTFNRPQDDDDDDFGDFSDFQNTQSSIPIVRTDIRDVCANVESLLSMMFPVNDSDTEELSTEIPSKSVDNTETLLNEITLAVRNLDDSKALEHQWLVSTGKDSLIKALGIDTRNILFGGKWNSSMPRYAANMSFNPLEPMKPEAAPGARTTEIPAAKFDWNSSGLVNPLDDQLVVVSANLDNINLASSAAAYSDGHRRRSSSFSSSPSNHTHSSPHSPSHHFIATSSLQIHSSDFDPDGMILSPLNPMDVCSIGLSDDVRRGQFDHFLDIRVQEIIHEANAAQNRPPRSDTDWPVRQQPPLKATHLPGGSTASQSSSFQLEAATSHSEDDCTDIPSPTSSSYVVPGSGTLKETHIFTPSKAKDNTSHKISITDEQPKLTTNIDADMFGDGPASGIRIDENVVKKEYRDIEYNLDLTPTNISDDFSDFQSVAPSKGLDCLQPIQSGVSINWPDPGKVTSVEISSFDEFVKTDAYRSEASEDKSIHIHSNPPVLSVDNLSKNQFNVNDLERQSTKTLNDKAYSRHTAENVLKPSSKYDELFDFMPNTPEKTATHIITEPKHIISNGSEITTLSSNTQSKTSNSFDDFSGFRSVPAPNAKPSIVPQMMQPIAPTPVLIPKRAQPPIESPPKSEISWPEPGIDADEMARLEAIFPTPKTISLPKPNNGTSPKRQVPGAASDEVEWTDFVSSTAGFQPITHIINQNILRHQQEKPATDDDDWSDFVSGGTPAANQFSPLKMATTASGPNFPAWNAAPTQFGSWSLSAAPSNVFTSTISSSLPPKDGSPNRTPNISLIPDLGFVAPPPPFNRGSSATSSGRSGSHSFASARK